MNLHKHQWYLLEQHSKSYEIWSAIIRINTEGSSLNMKLGPGFTVLNSVLFILSTWSSVSYNYE